MSAPLISIICAIHNSEATLQRMLDSILAEDLNTEDFEILACDDCSTDRSLEILHSFIHQHPDINMSILRTSEDSVHCPGNTRQYGLSQAKGNWIRFIDGDDAFANHGCKQFLDYINSCPEYKVMVKSEVAQVAADQTPLQQFRTNTTILHGNFYERQFLLNHDISFSPDMKIFEDLYFNSSCFASVFYLGQPETDFGYIDAITYNWTVDKSTLSSQLFHQSKGHLEIYYIDDWIRGAFSPFEKYLHIWPVNHAELFVTRVCQITYGLYYYYENALSREYSDEIDPEVIAHAKESIHSYLNSVTSICKNAFRVEMADMLKSFPDIFCEEYFSVTDSNNYFVPEHSFKEFIQIM